MNRSRPDMPVPWWAKARGRGVPCWGAVCSAAAPVLLAVGSTIGGHLQPRPYNAMTRTCLLLLHAESASEHVRSQKCSRWHQLNAWPNSTTKTMTPPW
jgi:hypothetical protein